MTVYALESSGGLAARLAAGTGDRLVFVEKKEFPDGETYVRIPEKPEGVAVLVGSLYPPQDKRLVELLLATEALSAVSPDRVVLVVPYLAYARQDRRFLEGEPISVKVVLKSLEAAGASGLIVVDVHKPSSLEEYLSIPHRNVVPSREIAEYFSGKLSNPLVLAPDAGALERARAVAEHLGAEYDYIVKERDRVSGEVKVRPRSFDVRGRDVLIVDDIVSTGGTMALAAREALKQGAAGVFAACSHAVMVRGALDLMLSSGIKEVVATDTVPSQVSKITVAPSLVEGLRSLLDEML
ncbi:MAG: ribose-phosphate diphosphokinase [Thermofilum sp.]|uniref:Ribose-phosphate pyrophosphokinase n=1 Tax=Thermofilum pendens TaxID=2269 RepID=A0A7C4D5C4_THEPE